MKLLTEYLDSAAHSEAETIPIQKLWLRNQSMAHLKFAGRRVRELRTPPPRLLCLRISGGIDRGGDAKSCQFVKCQSAR